MKKGPSTSHRKAIQSLYASDVLQRILVSAESIPPGKDGDLAFSEFQRDLLQNVFSGFRYDFCATSIVNTETESGGIEVQSICLDFPDSAIENYMNHAHLDELSPLVYRNPGRVLSYTQVISDERAEEHPFYIAHLSKYNFRRGFAVGFHYGGHRQTFITFDYLGRRENASWDFLEKSRFELASFPFAQAYLHRYGVLDRLELARQFLILQDFTEAQLANLRKYINSPHERYAQQAETLGIKSGTLQDDLRATRTIILQKLRTQEEFAHLAKDGPLRILDEHCSFMRALGDHTTPIDFG